MKRLLEGLVIGKMSGPSPSFSVVHLIKALGLIAGKPIGRNKLSQSLAIGEGATRTLIERLRLAGLITVDRKGCTLSKKGARLWRDMQRFLPRKAVLGRSGLALAEFNVAVLVKGHGSKVKLGMEQRDAALMIGAKGATTLVFKDGKLVIPPDNRSVAEDFPEIHKQLVNSLQPEENDVVVIGSADTLEQAEYGALAAAWILIDDQEPC